ncbi:hypothetical protein CRE_08466 [Caenorhabditis remanei]|uniref:Uncharacterized protein n=1 Tax=Caenorhabditis remanei TaxID=31234 RepID=E3N021_CAERE|nr:hypothetical protein CRE_08466 [Caenorhabditis remanei]
MAAQLIIHTDFLNKVMKQNRAAIRTATSKQINILVEIVFNMLNSKNIPLTIKNSVVFFHYSLTCRCKATLMKLIRKYHVIPYENGFALESAKRFLETILSDTSLDVCTKCRFYQDMLYRIRNHSDMPIVNDEMMSHRMKRWKEEEEGRRRRSVSVKKEILPPKLIQDTPQPPKIAQTVSESRNFGPMHNYRGFPDYRYVPYKAPMKKRRVSQTPNRGVKRKVEDDGPEEGRKRGKWDISSINGLKMENVKVSSSRKKNKKKNGVKKEDGDMKPKKKGVEP